MNTCSNGRDREHTERNNYYLYEELWKKKERKKMFAKKDLWKKYREWFLDVPTEICGQNKDPLERSLEQTEQ